jgi:hypothetical protein
MEVEMAFSDTDRFKRKDDVLLQELGGEAVLLDLGGEQYYGLDEVGLRIFQLLGESKSIAETCQMLLEEYEVDPVQLRSDLDSLLTNLLKAGLLVKAND